MKKVIQRHLEQVLTQLYPQAEAKLRPTVDYADNLQFGQLSTSAALSLASSVKQPPRQMAEQIAGQLKDIAEVTDLAEDITVDGPGYINFQLKPSALWQESSRFA